MSVSLCHHITKQDTPRCLLHPLSVCPTRVRVQFFALVILRIMWACSLCLGFSGRTCRGRQRVVCGEGPSTCWEPVMQLQAFGGGGLCVRVFVYVYISLCVYMQCVYLWVYVYICVCMWVYTSARAHMTLVTTIIMDEAVASAVQHLNLT